MSTCENCQAWKSQCQAKDREIKRLEDKIQELNEALDELSDNGFYQTIVEVLRDLLKEDEE